MPNNVPLGMNAMASILNGSSVAAAWQWTSSLWLNGSGYVLPIGSNVQIVLDTGLQSNSTLSGSIFCVELSTHGGGVLGFYLSRV